MAAAQGKTWLGRTIAPRIHSHRNRKWRAEIGRYICQKQPTSPNDPLLTASDATFCPIMPTPHQVRNGKMHQVLKSRGACQRILPTDPLDKRPPRNVSLNARDPFGGGCCPKTWHVDETPKSNPTHTAGDGRTRRSPPSHYTPKDSRSDPMRYVTAYRRARCRLASSISVYVSAMHRFLRFSMDRRDIQPWTKQAFTSGFASVHRKPQEAVHRRNVH